MKTTLSRLKTLIDDNNNAGGTLEYVRSVEIVHPEIGLTIQSIAKLPCVLITPENTSESWVATQRKQAIHSVSCYLAMQYFTRQSSIMGDSTRAAGQGKGIMDFVTDFLSVVRGHRLSVDGTIYLTKPLDVVNVQYITQELGENTYMLVAQVQLRGERLFLQESLPGDI